MKPHHRIYFLQFVFALSMGALLSRLPDLQVKFGLTEGQVGLMLITMSFGVLCGLTFAGRLVDRFGARVTAFVAVFSASALYALIPWMPGAVWAAAEAMVARLIANGVVTPATDSIEDMRRNSRREALIFVVMMSPAYCCTR